uniref:UDP-glucose 4-epimerase n=1 Tax=Strigamia maritima TaxID=126957 RepID=T1J1N4_STRMM
MSGKKCVFVTGGAGYIGSHTVVDLLQSGFDVVAIDNFANSVNGNNDEAVSLERVEKITGQKATFYKCDLLDKQHLKSIFSQHRIDCVIHFAAMKAVGESMKAPLLYYKNNVVGTIHLLEVMKSHHIFNLVFSSSCCVYGTPHYLPIKEDHPTGHVTNVYGRTKYLIEEMLSDLCNAEKEWNIISLRYFNPVGAHPSGLIGEDPTKPFTNLMPYIAQVAIGRKPLLTIFGGDYDTKDGTGVRDYIHVMDLASGHVAALNKLFVGQLNYKVYNLGTGKGITVLELVSAFEKASGHKVPYKIEPRRLGDITSMYADSSLAEKELNWKATYDLDKMCEDFWHWQSSNPDGYRTANRNGTSCNGDTNGGH